MFVNPPEINTGELVMRAFTLADAADVQRLAGDERIADTTANVPHPYPEGEAERWIAGLQAQMAAGETLTYAVALAETGALVGSMSLMHIEGDEAEIGYWVGVPYWGRGIASAAARAIIDHGFNKLGLRRIHARVLSRNGASDKVLAKLGFKHLGNQPTRCGYRQEEEPTDYYEILAPD
jgi:RimJ/RimL family protein N-acetyltransferase